MKLEQRGKYYELLIIRVRITKFVFDVLVQIGFDNDEKGRLRFVEN